MKKAFIFSVLIFGALILVGSSVNAQTTKVDGDWDASMSTPGGPRPFKLIFKTEGEKLTGTVKRSAGDVPLEGTVKGDLISFSYTINYNGNALSLFFSGKVEGEKISGTVSFGGNAEDSWSATRSAANKPK